jgi:UDP-N-acetylmuramyl tripeptide synthase
MPHWRYAITAIEGDTTTFSVSSPEGEVIELVAPIIGEHMVANAALAAVMLILQGVAPTDLGRAMGPGTPGIPVFVPGRVAKVLPCLIYIPESDCLPRIFVSRS